VKAMNKNIIIAILVVIIIAAGAAIMFGHSTGKIDTQINFLNNDTIQNGEKLQFELKDTQGNPVTSQVLNISYNNEKYSVTTDQNGKGYLYISGENDGKYDITVQYAGNEKYNGCDGKFSITITSEAPDNSAPQTSDQSTASTEQNNNRTDPNPNPDPQPDGVYWLGQYEVEVRASDNIVIAAPNGLGVGLHINDWLAIYGAPPEEDVPSDYNSTG
jgi:hypothetical protein